MRPVHVDWVRDAGGLRSAEEEKEKWEVDVVNRKRAEGFIHFVARFPFMARERRIRSCVYFGAPISYLRTPVLVVFIFFLFFSSGDG